MTKEKPKKKALPEKAEPTNNRGKLIKALIIGGTFVAIAILSIVTQGPGNGWPGPGVIVARILLFAACTAVYFVMLYRMQASRRSDEQNRRTDKK